MIDADIIFNQVQIQRRKLTQNLYGLFRATVISNGEERSPTETYMDKAKSGRIKVLIHAIHGQIPEGDAQEEFINKLPWAEYCSPFGGSDDTGVFFVPEVNATVFVMFVNGNPLSPVWIGTWWSHEDNPEIPRSAYSCSKYPYNRVIRTRAGHQIEIDDSPLNSGIRVMTANGNFIHISDTENNTITIHCNGDLNHTVDGNYNLNVKGDINIGANNIKTTFENSANLVAKDTNISSYINMGGDINIDEGNLKLHKGSIAIDKPGHINVGGKIQADNDIATLGNVYVHGTITADKSIYTKENFYDKYIKGSTLYTNISKWLRKHIHKYDDQTIDGPIVDSLTKEIPIVDEVKYKEPKINIITKLTE